ncbi:hypothetical protein H5968_00365 [Sphaerospermopsis sp. LEGE 00249]|uniref:hypothetical protein n=1 Tax=Sphaerospermopsis sp. LEGE 00249 TaxID=1380707 RepID=UPI00164E4E9C|nr:hypothetical protein [Sphaerospermopsis sp. LEGE 00249]MBC5793649.1 hypothetical protein [Sphaerospermopsis sp. LEGE 00249]
MLLSHLKNNGKLSKAIVLTLALSSLLACGVDISNNHTSGAIPSGEQIQIAQNTLPRNISEAVLRDASVRSRVQVSDLKISQVTQTTFSNRCIFEFKKGCTKEYKPIQGWVVVVQVKEQSWTYHVSQSSQIVIEPNINFFNASQLPRNIASKVLNDVANRSGVNRNSLSIYSSTSKIFSNSCVFNFGEVCAEIYQPVEGWVVVVKVKEESWTYHVNKSGSQIVIDQKIKANEGSPLPEKIAEKVLNDAYQRSRLQTIGIRITRTVQKTFSNSCVFNFGEICTQQYDPVEGWAVVLKVNNQFWTYHVDRTGSRIVLDPKVIGDRGLVTGDR